MPELFDPLEGDASPEILLGAKKRDISNILKSYVGFYDPLCELIQNAMDAVDVRKAQEAAPQYSKHIYIEINLKTNSIKVVDNGIGFQEEQFKMFLCPHISYKSGAITRGKKGVGASYLAYGFNKLLLETKANPYEVSAEIIDGRKWLDDSHSIVSRPKVSSSTSKCAILAELDRGSSFTLFLGGENTRPKDLRWVGATTAEQWKVILLLKTPLGHLGFRSEHSNIIFDLTVFADNNTTTSLVNQKAIYIYPHTVTPPVKALSEIQTVQSKRIEKGLDPGQLPASFSRLNGVYEFYDTDTLLGFFSLEESKALLRKYSVTAYGYFCYSTKVWEHYNDNVARLRRGLRILRGGLQLATDDMIQGETIAIPLNSNIGYQNQTSIIVHLHNADPDLGRKGFQPELKELAEGISKEIVNKLKKRRAHLRADSGAPPVIEAETALDTWIQYQKDHAKNFPLSITNENFFQPLKEIAILAEPLSEQDVVVLFNQLIAGGVIRGLQLLAASSHLQYDGIFHYVVKEPLANHIFDGEKNPLGIAEGAPLKAGVSKAYVLEYKHNVDALIADFENGSKQERDIELVVAWEMGEEFSRRYSVTSLLQLDNLQHRPFHGLTHIIHNETTGEKVFYGIILSELVSYLNDPVSVQEWQKQKYETL